MPACDDRGGRIHSRSGVTVLLANEEEEREEEEEWEELRRCKHFPLSEDGSN